MEASCRLRSSSCSRAMACCFLLGLSSPLFLRNKPPREVRRWVSGGDVEETMVTEYGCVSNGRDSVVV